jgi:SOS-response transcriptional repressor LexA
MDVVRKLILEKLQELGLTMSEASLKIGKNHAYLQQFLKRGYPLELPEKSRIPLANLIGVSEEVLRGTSSALPTRSHTKPNNALIEPNLIAQKARVVAQSSISGAEQQNFLDNVRSLSSIKSYDLPVFGTTQANHEILILSDRPVDWATMPDFLARVDGAYGMLVSGDVMDPEHKSGSTALVNPHLPPRNGDTCIFRCRRNDGVEIAKVRHLVRFTDSTWYVRQHNPKKDSTLKRSEWMTCHVIVGNYSRR